MNWEWLRPTRKSGSLFGIVSLVYLVYVFFTSSTCTMARVVCRNKPHHSVPAIFPGASSCQVCATTGELFWGYVQMVLLWFVLPLLALYVVTALVNRFFS